MRLSIMTLVMLACAGCAGGGLPSSPTTAPASSSAAQPSKWTAIVNTDEGGECDPQAKPGDCWLPIHAAPVLTGNPLNLLEKEGSTCREEQQAKCWPQPNDTLNVDCVAVGMDGRLWYGIAVPNERVLNGTQTKGKPTTHGYASSQWFRLRRRC